MKLLCYLFFLGLISFAHPGKGEFRFNEETHEFGKIPKSKPVTYVFTFVNSGDKPIIIFEVKPICGCTIADYTKIPVKKNEKGFIKVTYNARVVGGFNKAVVINSNANPPTKYLTIKGQVY